MTQVSVDLEDLAKVVLATSVIKTIEGAIFSHKRDPFVPPQLEWTAAHDRLAVVMRNAQRAQNQDTLVKFNEPLTDEETKALQEVSNGKNTLTVKEKLPGHGEDMSVYDRLAAKGCVVMGNLVEGVVWAGAPAPEIKIAADGDGHPKGFAIKLTDRGYGKLTTPNG